MDIKQKLKALAVLTAGMLLTWVAVMVWSSVMVERHLNEAESALGELQLTIEMRQKLNRVYRVISWGALHDRKTHGSHFLRAREELDGLMKEWSASREKTGSRLEMERVLQVKESWRQILQLAEELFSEPATMEDPDYGRIISERLVPIVDSTRTELMYMIKENALEIHDAYHLLLSRLSVLPWIAGRGAEEVKRAMLAADYFYSIDDVASLLNGQVLDFVQHVSAGETEWTHGFEDRGGETMRGLGRWRRAILLQIEAGVPGEQGDLEALTEIEGKYVALQQKLLHLESEGKFVLGKGADDVIHNEIESLLENGLMLAINTMLEDGKTEVSESHERLLTLSHRSFLVASLLLAVFSFAVVYFVLKTVQGIIVSLDKLAEGVEFVGSGHLGHRVALESNDEFGVLARSFNKMVEDLRAVTVSRDKMDRVLSSMLDALIIVDRSGLVRSANRSARTLLDWEGDGRGLPLEKVLVCESRTGKEEVAHLLKRKKVFSEERMLLTRDGREVPVLLSSSELNVEGREADAVLLVARDISELKTARSEKQQLWEELLQAQKMESIGRLAGGVAHDFNNFMSVVIGFSDLALLEMPRDDPQRKNLSTIREAGEKAANVAGQLLAFSRRQVLQMKAIDLGSVVERLDSILKKTIGEEVVLEVMADPGQIEQVLMNLAINAKHAMPNGGHLSIETRDMEVDEDFTEHHEGIKPGSYVMLAVTDTGAGMTAEVQRQIFDPFFTTKGIGRGTGLGLSTVYGIIKQHNANIYVDSQPGRGTTFRIFFDPHREKAEKNVDDDVGALPRGRGTILAVDDEPSIRMLIAETLSPLGYRVLTASGGREALEKARAAGREIDLLLTDVIMPEMGGRKLVEKFKHTYPEGRVIYISGYPEEISSYSEILRGDDLFLPKPLLPRSLAEKVHEALTPSPESPRSCA